MKKLLLIFFLLLTASYTFANKVDALKTDSDVAKFLSPLIAKFRYPGADKNWAVKSWQQLDLNNDGLTDLIAIEQVEHSSEGFNFVVIDKGNNNFQLINLCYKYASGQESIEPVKKNGEQLIVFHGFRNIAAKRDEPKLVDRIDTLIYKFGEFAELNKEPAHYKIESITYSTIWGWYGDNTPPENTNPSQNLEIDHSGNATYTNNGSNTSYIVTKDGPKISRNPKTTIGTFKGKIKKSDLEEIENLINYLSIKNLKEKYAVNWTDDVSCYVRIKFADGSVKYIADYGGKGTFGLEALFHKLFALRDSQDWK